jgi:hypothetical protein
MEPVVVFGDSIAAGLGAQGHAFPALLADQLGTELVDRAGSASMVNHSQTCVGDVKGLVIVMHGITEAIPRPPRTALRWMPRRWTDPGHLDPRPYFSTRRRKLLAQRLESGVRWRLRNAMMRLHGTERWMSIDEYEHRLRALLDALSGSHVIVAGGLPIDDRFFPGATAALRDYAERSQRVAEDAGAVYVDLSDTLDRWDDFLADRFHPNISGHRKIADRIVREVAPPDSRRHSQGPSASASAS